MSKMKLDNEAQRSFLLEVLKTISVPGDHIEFAYALMVALKTAEIEGNDQNGGDGDLAL